MHLTPTLKYEWTVFCRQWFRIGYEAWMATNYPQLRTQCACCGMTTDGHLICRTCVRSAATVATVSRSS